jgi:hypothetical protein
VWPTCSSAQRCHEVGSTKIIIFCPQAPLWESSEILLIQYNKRKKINSKNVLNSEKPFQTNFVINQEKYGRGVDNPKESDFLFRSSPKRQVPARAGLQKHPAVCGHRPLSHHTALRDYRRR